MNIPPSINVSQTHGFTSNTTDNLVYTKTIKLDNGENYKMTITFTKTDTHQTKEAFLNKFDDLTSKKVVNAAVNMGLGVRKNKGANAAKNKPIREYTITSMRFHIGEDGEMRIRKTKKNPGELAEIDNTKKFTQTRSPIKQGFLLDIKSVFTGIVTNQQGRQFNQQNLSIPSQVHNINQNDSNALQPNQNQQSIASNAVNSAPIQQTFLPPNNQLRPVSAQQPQPVSSQALTKENNIINQNEELIKEYANQTKNNSILDSETLLKIKDFDPDNNNSPPLSSLIPEGKKINFINGFINSDIYKKAQASENININRANINKLIFHLRDNYDLYKNNKNINELIDKLNFKHSSAIGTFWKPPEEISDPIQFLANYKKLLDIIVQSGQNPIK